MSSDKYLEFITAGLNRLTMPEADIQCDVRLAGRQFDVVATVNAGLHAVLLAFEVKHKSRRVGVEQIEAFITKARDIGANKIVFVSTSGFQSGCISLAKRHFVDLFVVHFTDDTNVPAMGTFCITSESRVSRTDDPPYIAFGEKELISVIERVYLQYATGERKMVPCEPSQMRYYMQKTKVSGDATLEDLVATHGPETVIEGNRVRFKIKRHNGRRILVNPPDKFFFPKGKLKFLEVEVVGVTARTVHGNTEIEPSAFSGAVIYENVITRERVEAQAHSIPVGPVSLEVGKFYFTLFPLQYFYCEKREERMLTIFLVESFQMGKLVQSVLKVDVKHSRFYFPLTDKKVEERLVARLNRMRGKGRS